MRAGAGDYVTKPFEMEEFLHRVHSLLHKETIPPLEPSLGISEPMQMLEHTLKGLVKSRKPLLLTGEIGVGKEFAARWLHDLFAKDTGPFIAVNCVAIPNTVIERELFGCAPGLFEDMKSGHAGYVERAAGGTLYLDGIASLAPDIQARLLRLIEEGSFCSLGSADRMDLQARIVCATRADLVCAEEQGRLRADLYNEISEARLHICALRERPEDINWHIERCLVEFQNLSIGNLRGMSFDADSGALAYEWPRNVTELRHRMERAVALALEDWISPLDLFPERGFGSWSGRPAVGSLAQAREAAESRQIERALALHDGQVAQSAATLGISRTTLWEKMRRLGMAKEN